ncbi:MAG: ABC transporter permease [Acidobacteriota bacterium]
MSGLRRFRNHLLWPLSKVSVAEEIDTEFDFHIEMRIRELIDEGLTPEEARAHALARFGNLRRIKRECRRAANARDRRMRWLERFSEVRQDLSFALRSMLRKPLWTLLVILTLGIGIGANSVVFSVVDAVLLSPLPYPSPAQLVRIWERTPEGAQFSTSEPNFLDFRELNRTFASIGAVTLPPSLALLGDGEPEAVSGMACTASYFDVMGVAARLGRTFLPDEDSPGSAAHVVVLSHEFWRGRFGADPDILGRPLDLNGETWHVIGVMPAGFGFPFTAEAWIPLASNPSSDRNDHRLELIGRLKPGISIRQAREDLAAVAAQLGRSYPASNAGWSVMMQSLRDWAIGPAVERAALVLQATVGLMLLLACANVSCLLIARATTRRHEIGVRSAIGASRARIIRQLLTESAFLGICGAGVGLLVVTFAIPVVRTLGALPRLEEVSINRQVLLVTLCVSLASSILAGLVPALQISGAKILDSLRDGSRGTIGGAPRLRDAMVVLQIAGTLILLVAAGLLIGSFLRLRGVDAGFSPDHVLKATFSPPQNRYPEGSREAVQFYRELLERVRSIPGVQSAAAGMVDPFSGYRFSNQAGEDSATELREFVRVQWRVVTEDYFRTMGIPVLRGRTFVESDTATDQPQGPPSIIVSQGLADRLWPGEDPVGRRVRWSSLDGPILTVAGVVGDVRDAFLDAEPPPMLYLPENLVGWPRMTVFIRTPMEAGALASAVRAALTSVDDELPPPALLPLRQSFRQATAGSRLNAQLLALFALIALVIASVGTYGVMAFSVARRRQEIGVRMALGAKPSGVVYLMLKKGLWLVGAGVVLGLAGTLAVTHSLASLLYDTPPLDVGTILGVTVLLVAAGLLASYLPSRRAAEIDPALVLRPE